MKLWKASTARRTQSRPLTSRHRAEPFDSSCAGAGVAAASSAVGLLAESDAFGTVSFSLLLQLAGGQDDEGLSPGVIIGHRQMYVDCVAFRRKGVKPRLRPAGKL